MTLPYGLRKGVAVFVIPSKRSASRDLRTVVVHTGSEMRRSFDSLRSLRMTTVLRLRALELLLQLLLA